MLLVAVFLALLRMSRTALLGPFLGTRRKVLFVVVSEVVDGRFVDFDGPSGHTADVLYDHLVVGVFLIVFETLRTHVAGHIVHRAGHDPAVAFAGKFLDDPLDILAVVLVGDPPLRIGHAMRRHGQLLTGRTRIGAIHIQLKIRHDEQMIPQLVGEIRRIAQQRIQVTHDGDDGPRLAVALVPVLDLEQRLDHLLDMAPVFGQVQLASCVVIVLFHRAVAIPDAVSFGRRKPPVGLVR